MGLILVDNIQRITNFKDGNGTFHIVADLKLLGHKDLKSRAKKIDKENYIEDCFCIDYNYIETENKLYLLDNGFYYIDNDGNKHYMEINNIELSNIRTSVALELTNFFKNKEKYIKKNNWIYEEI